MIAHAVENAMHLTDQLLIGSNFLIILATVALSYYTAKAAQETAREVKREDSRILRLLVKKNRNAKHSKENAE